MTFTFKQILQLRNCTNCRKSLIRSEISPESPRYESELIQNLNEETGDIESLECPHCRTVWSNG